MRGEDFSAAAARIHAETAGVKGGCPGQETCTCRGTPSLTVNRECTPKDPERIRGFFALPDRELEC